MAAVCAFLLLSGVGSVTLGSRRMDAAQIPGPRSPRPVVIWAARIGSLSLAINASSLVWFLFVDPSIVSALLFWLMPVSLAVGVADVAVYLRERLAVSRSSAPPRKWAVIVLLSVSMVTFVLVVLCVVLFHDAQLGNFDPGGF